MNRLLKYLFATALFAGTAQAAPLPSTNAMTTYHRVQVDGVGIFYREAGPENAPTIVLLHGFPSSSREFDTLIPLLATSYLADTAAIQHYAATKRQMRHDFVVTLGAHSSQHHQGIGEGGEEMLQALPDCLGLGKHCAVTGVPFVQLQVKAAIVIENTVPATPMVEDATAPSIVLAPVPPPS